MTREEIDVKCIVFTARCGILHDVYIYLFFCNDVECGMDNETCTPPDITSHDTTRTMGCNTCYRSMTIMMK